VPARSGGEKKKGKDIVTSQRGRRGKTGDPVKTNYSNIWQERCRHLNRNRHITFGRNVWGCSHCNLEKKKWGNQKQKTDNLFQLRWWILSKTEGVLALKAKKLRVGELGLNRKNTPN